MLDAMLFSSGGQFNEFNNANSYAIPVSGSSSMVYLAQPLPHDAVSFLTYGLMIAGVSPRWQKYSIDESTICYSKRHVLLGEEDNDEGFYIGILEGSLLCCKLSACGGVHDKFSFQ